MMRGLVGQKVPIGWKIRKQFGNLSLLHVLGAKLGQNPFFCWVSLAVLVAKHKACFSGMTQNFSIDS